MATEAEFYMSFLKGANQAAPIADIHDDLVLDFDADHGISYNEELHDFRAALMDVCYLLEEDSCEFLAGGFDNEVWPVDVDYDLSLIIAKLPEILRGVSEKEEIEIPFHEYRQSYVSVAPTADDSQRVILSFHFKESDGAAVLVQEMSSAKLIAMLTSLLEAFLASARNVAPEVISHSILDEWRESAERFVP